MKTVLGNDGVVYRMSDRNWKRMCKTIAADPDRMGTCLTEFGARKIAVLDHDITDWDAVDYEHALD